MMPISVIYLDAGLPPPVREPDLPTLLVSDQVGFVILMIARAMTFLALLPTLLVIFVRHRRATGPQRTQLRWLLWAAIICAILVAVSLLVRRRGGRRRPALHPRAVRRARWSL